VRAHAIAFLAALCAAGCAHYQSVGVESDPAGADIYLDGELVGKTPMEVDVGRDAAHTLYLKREGYRPELVLLERHEANDGIDFLTPADVTRRLSPGPSSDPDLERRLKIDVEKDKKPDAN
jgi:PEGA domain-containing protein